MKPRTIQWITAGVVFAATTLPWWPWPRHRRIYPKKLTLRDGIRLARTYARPAPRRTAP